MIRSNPYILIAEDDIDDVDFFISVLSRKYPQVSVKHIGDGQAVLDFLGACTVDELPGLLLLDYKMPLASAADVLRYIKEKGHFASVGKAVWSTSGRDEEREECQSLGAEHFFTKPASEAEWEVLVSKIGGYFIGKTP